MPPDNVKIIHDNSPARILYWDFYICSWDVEQAKQSKLLLPEIKKQCAIQIEELKKTDSSFNHQKIAKIEQALIYLEEAMDLKIIWSSKKNVMIHQGKNEPQMSEIICRDFSSFERAMTYSHKTVDWIVRPATESDQKRWGVEPDGHRDYQYSFLGYNRNITEIWESFVNPIKHCSLQDALNLSPSNLFNFGLFGKSAHWGPMWGKTKELSEVETSVKSSISL